MSARIPALPSNLSLLDLVVALNDRLRRIDVLLTEVSMPIIVSLNELILPVPGVQAVNSNAAPLVSIPTNGTPTAIVALVKVAPTGAGLIWQVLAGVTLIGTGTIAAGTTAVTVTSSLVAIPANSVITLSITQVGSTIAGADLTVMIRF
jgi:hypothetical protein